LVTNVTSVQIDNFDFGDDVDVNTFQQILDMDDGEDEGDREFSSSIVFGFLDQASETFDKMETKMWVSPVCTEPSSRSLTIVLSKEKDLQELSGLGHFLKGSSATLGFTKVKDQCEKIQHYGLKKDETGEHDEPDEEKCLRLIQESLTKAKAAYTTVSDKMNRFFSSSD
jgi:osomolarity two-component system, phosphorelay intermediate protein YPD1